MNFSLPLFDRVRMWGDVMRPSVWQGHAYFVESVRVKVERVNDRHRNRNFIGHA
ncbi:MAG: hypothetical protein Q8L02_03820 [Candidatus Nitrotoga sp.]|nr:hypothetical protein [Candidatus Nitrotoga sp.]